MTNKLARIRAPFHSLFSFPSWFDSVFEEDDDIGFNILQPSVSSIINSKEVDGAKEIYFELPGLKKEDVDITIKDGVLTVHSKCDEKEERKLKNMFFTSIKKNEFTKSFALGDMFDEEKIEAKLEDGILAIRLPYDLKKLKEKDAKKIEIK